MKYLLILTIIFTSTFSIAQELKKEYYFYHPEINYGSEQYLNPLTSFLNGAYDVLRNGGHENNGETIDIFNLDYHTGFSNVWDNISQPAYHISRYGWSRFLKQEIFPASLAQNKAQWVPNYGHHILGSGMLWVRMSEWYDYYGYSNPKLLAFLATTSYQFMNEALENNHSTKTNVDPIADLLIFNPLGFLVFSSTAVKEFFSKTVRMYDWSLQPLFNPENHYLENAGLQFTFKYALASKIDAFFYFGIYGIGGFGYALDETNHISIGVGTVVNRLNENVEKNIRFVTPTTDGALGIFYDKNHSLLASLIFTGPRLYNARLNIYPGLLSIKGIKPGLFIGTGQWDGLVAGFTVAHFPFGILGETSTGWKK